MAGPIPAAAFYGSSGRRLGAVPDQQEATSAQLQRASVCRPPRPSLLGPALTWEVFPRQAAALQVAAARPGLRLMVFGCEERVPGGGGKRSYLVCHPSVFWQCDEQKRPEDRCSYEVIRQGTPCKLYLDLEYDKTLNPDRDGDVMVETFIRVIASVVEHLFEVKCRRSDVVDLCASSERKFSRHLIFCCSSLVFCDNITVGNLVKDICDAIRSFVRRGKTEGLRRLGLQRFGKDELSELLVESSSENSLFCDEGVYTKNRNFRVYKSSKFGKRRPLIKSVHNKYPPESKSSRTKNNSSAEEEFFLASLVSQFESSTRPLKYDATSFQQDVSASSTVPGRHSSRPQGGGTAASPYPDIDAFVRELVSPGGIRCWNYFDSSELLVYDIVGFRFCHNIGRWHRSNNILIVVSLREASFYQKCHDPACRGFRSDSLPLPSRLLAWRELGDDWEADDEGGDAEGSEQFLDCGANDSEMLTAAALTEPASDGGSERLARPQRARVVADAELGQSKTPSEAVDIKRGVPRNAVAISELDASPVLTVPTPPDLFPDCGMGDSELAAVPAGIRLSQDSCDGRVTDPPPADILPNWDDPFPDCGVGDSELLEEVSTEPLSICSVRDGDDQPTESIPNQERGAGSRLDTEADSFPDCGVEDAELSAVPCSGGQRRSPADTTGPVEFPDCGVGDWELSDPDERSDQAEAPPESPDLFPDCGVGDWELCEVGRPACAATVTADTSVTSGGTVHTPATGSRADQTYFTAKTSRSDSHFWDDLTEADLSDLQF